MDPTYVPETLQDFLAHQDQLEQEAREMYPFNFDTCSYDQGYVKQQVFACKTCYSTSEDLQRGGICYSCSIQCHGDHELIELFNKRSFRCDCSTKRMGDDVCRIRKTVDGLNQDNKYNHNFVNKFCWCDAEYGSENDDNNTMFQCILCEDWFHDTCIKQSESLPSDDRFDHYICRVCVGEESWLEKYKQLPSFAICDKSLLDTAQSALEATTTRLDSSRALHKRRTDATEEESLRVTKRQEMDGCVAAPTNSSSCKWELMPDRPRVNGVQSLFLMDDFRDYFCRCGRCEERLLKFPILMAEEAVYEPLEDQDEPQSLVNAGMQILEALPRESAIEGILAYNKLRDDLSNFLKPFADKKEIVTAEDINTYFRNKPMVKRS